MSFVRWRAALSGCVALLSGMGCSSSSQGESSVSFPSTGPSPDDVVAFSRLTNIIPSQVTAGGSTGWVIVDTGNPWVLLDPVAFPAAARLASGGQLSSVTAGSETVANPFTFGSASGDLMADATFTIDGNVGCTVICGYTAAFNYRDVTFALAGGPAPSAVGPATVLPFKFLGGSSLGGVAVPRSRIVVVVSLEGTDYSMIVDTGASDVTLSKQAFTALTSDGRTTIAGGAAQTTSGTSSSSLTRASSVVVGGVEVKNAVVAHDTSFDANLSAVSADVGQTIDGSLGGTFLRNFFLTIDYAAQTLTLAPYMDESFALDQAEHVGIVLGTEGQAVYGVAQATGDAAAKGATVGDVITAIDGVSLASLSTLQVSTLLFGVVGSSKQVTFGNAATLSGQTVAMLVEESLPLP